MNILGAVVDFFVGGEKLSDAAKYIGAIFKEECVGKEFFDAVFVRFMNFDDQNRRRENRAFYEDVDFITQCFNSSLESQEDLAKFKDRIDSYLYVCMRVREYLEIMKKNHYADAAKKNIEKLHELIITNASKIFLETKGLQPNVTINDKELLGRMKLDSYRQAITTVDITNVEKFFCSCKLALQASFLIDPGKVLECKWKTIIKDVREFKISLEVFIEKYVSLRMGFQDFPFDVAGFVELLNRLPLVPKSTESLFNRLFTLLTSLALKPEEFLTLFLPIFAKELKSKHYSVVDVGDFLNDLSGNEHFFVEYLSASAACADDLTLWKVFLYVCQTKELNEIIQNHFCLKLNDRFSKLSCCEFLGFTKLGDQSMEKMTEERRPQFRKVYLSILNAYLCQNRVDVNRPPDWYSSDLKQLLKVLLRCSASIQDAVKEPAFPSIIQNILFLSNKNDSSREKLKHFLKALNEFEKKIQDAVDFQNVLKDDWI